AHLIPAFSSGRGTTSLRYGNDELDDWEGYYVGIFMDRDMFMLLRGMARDCADVDLADSLEPEGYGNVVNTDSFDGGGEEEDHDSEDDEDTNEQESDGESDSDLDEGIEDGEGKGKGEDKDKDKDKEDSLSF
ncbi:uncharacterized protein F5147DRAFT_712400, partial [Suillus discolor]